MSQSDGVTILVLTSYEVETISDVIWDFSGVGITGILVVNSGSADDTQSVAGDAGACVVKQTGERKGKEVRETITEHVDLKYAPMLDGNSTYDAEATLDPLRVGEAEHVI